MFSRDSDMTSPLELIVDLDLRVNTYLQPAISHLICYFPSFGKMKHSLFTYFGDFLTRLSFVVLVR